MKNISQIFAAILFTAYLFSCQKEDEINPNDKNSVSIEFENRVGDQKLVLGSTKATNAMGEDFTVTTLNYFISNVSLKNENGEVVKFPNDYFLVRQADEKSLTITLNDLPAGNYTELSYIIGVDSLKSISDVAQRTGVLDPASYGSDNMYWSWNSGYIFFKIEGNSTKIPVSASPTSQYQYHIGGFGGRTAVTPNNLKTITFKLTTTAKVRKDTAPVIHLINDVTKVFSVKNKLSFATLPTIHSASAGTAVAENYAQSFIVDHVHNE